MLSVSPTLRACTQKEKKAPRKPSFPGSDAWARSRARELREHGVTARLRRYRRNEPLCVVYRA
jgi:hypothetical protein